MSRQKLLACFWGGMLVLGCLLSLSVASVVSVQAVPAEGSDLPPLSPNEQLRQGMFAGKGAWVREALLRGADPNFQLYDKFVLHWAVEYQHTDLIALLLEKKVNLNFSGVDDLTPLMRMAQSADLSKPEQVALIRRLIDAGMNPLQTLHRGTSALFFAARSGNQLLVALLLEKGANPNLSGPAGESPLMVAAHGGHLAVVKQLLEAGAELSYAQGGDSALTYALIGQQPAVVAFLIAQGLPVTAAAHGGESPLFSAIFALQPEGLRLVLEAGAEVEMRQDGETPLLRAAAVGFEPGLALLLTHGAAVHVRDPEGNTVLHKALRSGADTFTLKRMVALLLTHQADPNGVNQAGETPLALAQEHENEEIVEMLKKAGAMP